MKKWLKEHSLSLALFAVLLLQSWAFYVLRFPEWRADQIVDKQAHDTWHFLRHYWSEYTVSILADTYGALILVVFSKYFWERGSAESK